MRSGRFLFLHSLIVLLCITVLFFFGVSCEKKPVILQTEQEKTIDTIPHKWFYFSSDGFKEIMLPQEAPEVLFKPWTESVRVSSAARIGPYDYFLVNRQGLYRFSADKNQQPVGFFTDSEFFSDISVDSLLCTGEIPVFHTYKNSFFNSGTEKHPKAFLVQFVPETGYFLPLLGAKDLGLNEKSQSVNLGYNGEEWLVAFKSEKDSRVQFDYLIFSPYESLTDLPINKSVNLRIKEITSDEYKKKSEFEKFSEAPKALKNLLERLPANTTFILEATMADFGSPRIFEQGKSDSADQVFNGKSFISETFTLTVFSDGTSYFAGSLAGKYVLKGGTPIAFRLPKLPPDFIYTYFSVSGSTLYVAWEETRFFETARSGFLSVDLERVLYQ